MQTTWHLCWSCLAWKQTMFFFFFWELQRAEHQCWVLSRMDGSAMAVVCPVEGMASHHGLAKALGYKLSLSWFPCSPRPRRLGGQWHGLCCKEDNWYWWRKICIHFCLAFLSYFGKCLALRWMKESNIYSSWDTILFPSPLHRHMFFFFSMKLPTTLHAKIWRLEWVTAFCHSHCWRHRFEGTVETQVDGEVYTVTSHPLSYWNSLDEFYTKNIQWGNDIEHIS